MTNSNSKGPSDYDIDSDSNPKTSRENEIAMGFDGIDDYINVPDDPTLDLGTTCTITMWVLTYDNSKFQVFYDNMWMYDQGGYQFYYRISGIRYVGVFGE